MQITTEIDFDLEIDDMMREIAEEVMEANYCGYLTQDDGEALFEERLDDFVTRDSLDGDYMTWDRYNAQWHDQIDEYAEAMEFVVASDLRELENQVAIARRAVNILLEERERTLGRRARRLFTLTRSLLSRMVRRVHWHMPRR